MKKQLLLLVMLLLPMVARSADPVEIDGIYYNLVKKLHQATVTGNPSEYTGAVVIPENITYESENYDVVAIGDYAFDRCSGLTGVSIPNSVTSIGDHAFYCCTGLTSSFTIPNGVITIKDGAFWGCTNLTTITIPNSVTTIGSNAFQDTGLTSISIPTGVTSLSSTFSYCTNLTSVTIPNSVTSLSGTFYNCSSLASITIPNSVTNIGPATFKGCSNLTTITIPNNVTFIDSEAFYECSDLTTIVIGSGVTQIYADAFNNCAELADVYCYAENVPEIVNYTSNPLTLFNGSYIEYATLHVPMSSVSAYQAVEPWCNFGKIQGITDIITFADANVKAICVANWDTNGDGELSISEAAAVNSLSGISTAFSGNNTITSFDELSYFTGLSSIPSATFRGSSLSSITIPENVTSIGDYAFADCSQLTSITIPDGVTTIDYNAFRLSGLTAITIPGSVTSIGNSAFELCNLASIIVEAGNGTFDSRNNCNAIINSSTNDLMFGCKNTIIPNTVTSIRGLAFADCTGLTDITIPSSVTTIGNEAFSGCKGLTAVTIPSSVTTIGSTVFGGCTGLTSLMVMHDTPISISNMAFNNLYSQATLYVPSGSKAAYQAANFWKSFNDIREIPVITIGSLGMVTYCSDSDLDFTNVSDIKAYVACGFKPSTGTVFIMRVNEVPANTGIMVKGTPGTYTIPVKETDFYYTNMFKGTLVGMTVPETEDGCQNYVLRNGDYGLLFYESHGSSTLGANKAYLQVPLSASPAREFVELVEDNVTGIVETDYVTRENNEKFFNLNGQQVTTPKHGLYFRNGKKIIIR